MAETNRPDTFAWDLLYSLYEKNLINKSHVIIVWCHYNLLRRGYKNAGLGEDLSLPTQSDLKETLPDGWNSNLPCLLRYYFNKNLYTLTIQPADEDGDVVINLSRPHDNQISVTSMNTREIPKLNGRLEEILPDWSNLVNRINNELIDPLLNNATSKDVTCQTDTLQEPRGNRYQPTPAPSMPYLPRLQQPFRPAPRGIGAADLDPLGGGGGMLFQPPGMGRPRPFMPDPFLPRGVLPPGARFDPIFPGRGDTSNPLRGNFPDPDHLPPPGYDDMFS